jgi:hypothetical protein
MQEMTGYAWLASFFERNPEISIRQAEGFSLSRAQGMNREEIHNFFKCCNSSERKNLPNKPQSIFNADKSGIQPINKPGKF